MVLTLLSDCPEIMYTLKCHKTNTDKWKWISLDQPRTHSVQGLSLSGFWLPEPERHSGAHCRFDISAGQSAACHPWTTLNRDTCREETRLEDGVDIQKNLQNWIKMKERRKQGRYPYLTLGLGALCITQVNWASSPATKMAFLILFTKRGGTKRNTWQCFMF